MATLKELRLNANLSQSEVAALIKVQHPQISNYEAGISLPSIEEAVILEKQFGQRIDFKETLPPNRKFQTVQALIELSERFPLPMVLEFAARVYRREIEPDTLIIHYASLTNSEEPLSYMGFEINKKCSDCEDQ